METTPAKVNTQLLDEKLALLEKARPWSPRVISKFEGLLSNPDDYSLFRVNPLTFAKERGIGEQEAIDLFLHATKLGLFKMEWQVLCPSCGDAIESFGALGQLHSSYFCAMCHIDCQINLDDFIQVSFTVSPQIRDIAFHHPENLSVEDYCFKYHFNNNAKMPGMGLMVDIFKSVMKGLSYLHPGEKKTFETEADSGIFVGHDLINQVGFMAPIEGQKVDGTQPVFCRFTDDGIQASAAKVAPGRVRIEVENPTQRESSIILLLKPAGLPPYVLEFPPFLSGKKIFSNQTFRNLFRSETIGGNEGIGVKDLTFLFTDLKGSTALYERIGDLKAFSLVQQHFDCLSKSIQQNRGAIVKTIGDAVMASFEKPEDAVKAAAGMLEEIEEFNKEHGSKEIILKIGIHRGAAIAVTLNDRLDYFGQTVNIAARVQGLADAEEIYLTKNAYLSPGVKELLGDFYVTSESANLKGVQKAMQVYKVTYNPPVKNAGKPKARKSRPKTKKRKVKKAVRTKKKLRRRLAASKR